MLVHAAKTIQASNTVAFASFLLLVATNTIYGQATHASPPAIPPVIHLCSGHCLTYTWENGHFVNYTDLPNQRNEMRVLNVRSFTKELISFSEVETGSYPLSAIWVGKMSDTSSSTAEGTTRITVWAGKAVPNPKDETFKMSWGASLSMLPGSDTERDQRAASSAHSADVASTNQALPLEARKCERTNPQKLDSATSLSYAHKLDSIDLPAAVCWLYVSAAQGNATAQAEYSLMELSGSGTGKDEADAFVWSKKSAVQDNYEGEFILAILYASGIGTAKDPAKAQYWKGRALAHPEITSALKSQSESGTPQKKQTDSDVVTNFVAGFLQQYVGAPAQSGDYGKAMSNLDKLTETPPLTCTHEERLRDYSHSNCGPRDDAYEAWKRRQEANPLQK